MKKKLIVVLAALGLAWTGLAKEKVFILVAHPDDTLACAGTMFLMKDRFELHVMVLTHGERGNGQQGFLDGSTKVRRTKEEENAEAMVGATVHWGNEIDGECYPRPATCQQVAELMKELKPRAVIGMWPLDRHLDHAMAGATLLKALGIAGMREVIECYFMEQSYDTRTFVPAHYVDITDVMEEKRAYIRQYVSQNKDDYMCELEMQDSYMRAQRCSSWLLRGCPKNGGAERFAVYDGKPQGCRCIFAELPPPKCWSSDWKDAKPSKYTPEGGMKAKDGK